MEYILPVRNRERIFAADLRKIVDPPFEDMHDGLCIAYYDFWRNGKSKSWQGYDVQPTKEASKSLFDKLHGLIHKERHLKFHEENMKLPKKEQIPTNKYNDIIDKDGKVIDTLSERITSDIALLKNQNIEVTIDA